MPRPPKSQRVAAKRHATVEDAMDVDAYDTLASNTANTAGKPDVPIGLNRRSGIWKLSLLTPSSNDPSPATGPLANCCADEPAGPSISPDRGTLPSASSMGMSEVAQRNPAGATGDALMILSIASKSESRSPSRKMSDFQWATGFDVSKMLVTGLHPSCDERMANFAMAAAVKTMRDQEEMEETMDRINTRVLDHAVRLRSEKFDQQDLVVYKQMIADRLAKLEASPTGFSPKSGAMSTTSNVASVVPNQMADVQSRLSQLARIMNQLVAAGGQGPPVTPTATTVKLLHEMNRKDELDSIRKSIDEFEDGIRGLKIALMEMHDEQKALKEHLTLLCKGEINAEDMIRLLRNLKL
ncbi:hypothetical protein QBC40DRAFT_293834 [Triangularia verruculosa]|uniref:Uncharacterized protein n=1 Tax=Triangularia verruculosa TaxID=2587418 RepID=A0AAN7AXN4_9PEZI|nr:hypothetical protein QBC40DRAFT_293834 [Triangularia verruculosa]